MEAVDPALRPLLAQLPQQGFSHETLPGIRAAARERLLAAPSGRRDDVDAREVIVPGANGAPDVRLLLYTPKHAPRPLPLFFHIHGGGYVSGAADTNRAIHQNIAADLPCIVTSVDYRLAPETPHPGPIDDCHTALRWLHANAEDLGIDTARIAVSGESAGGGLAAALALLCRDRATVPIAFQYLIYPMLDDRTGTPQPHLGQFVWKATDNAFGWSCLLGGAEASPYAAAARADDLSGLPPAFISVGALDLLLPENLDYAARLARAGVPVEMHVYPHAFHGFQLAADAEIAQRANADALAALKRALR